MATEPDAPPLPHPTEGPEYFPPIVTDEREEEELPPLPEYVPPENQIEPGAVEPPPALEPPPVDPLYEKVAEIWDRTVDFQGMDEFQYQSQRFQDRLVEFYQLILAEPSQS